MRGDSAPAVHRHRWLGADDEYRCTPRVPVLLDADELCAGCGLTYPGVVVEGATTSEGVVSRLDVIAEGDGIRIRSADALSLLTAAEIMATPPPVEIVEDIAWAGCLTVLVSESGVAKTFVLLSVAAAVSDGVPWLGRDVRRGTVVYLSYEGDALSLRVRALDEHGGHRMEHLYIARTSDPLSPRVARDGVEEFSLGECRVLEALQELAAQLEREGRPPMVLIIIDTVRASLSGSEDSSEHVSAYLRAVRRIMATVPTAAAILAHHAGWQDGESRRRRERGSSAWRGNADAVLYLDLEDEDTERGEARLRLSALKVRDTERPAPFYLVRRRVELLAQDEHGDPSSCSLRTSTATRRAARSGRARRPADIMHHRARHADPRGSRGRSRGRTRRYR